MSRIERSHWQYLPLLWPVRQSGAAVEHNDVILSLGHTDQFLVEMFHNYAFKECISVENLKLWLLILTKTLFLMTILIKLTLGNIFINVKKSARVAPLSQKADKFFKCR